jgi:hypothetical protein
MLVLFGSLVVVVSSVALEVGISVDVTVAVEVTVDVEVTTAVEAIVGAGTDVTVGVVFKGATTIDRLPEQPPAIVEVQLAEYVPG